MFDFDLTQVEDQSSVVKAGTYSAWIERAEWKTSSAGNEYLNVMWRLTTNQVIFAMYNVLHPNDKPRNIALSEVKKMLLASGYNEDSLKLKSKEDLVEKLLTVRCDIVVSVVTSADFGEQNRIKGYKKTVSETANDVPF